MSMKDIIHLFFSDSPKMSKIKTIIGEIARTDITVLINGESGTGKDLVAQTIHLHSDRAAKPFVKVNCAAIPHGLLESELFGFEKGAFTGAHLKKPGKFELASGGTVLLNDIGEVDVSVQAKLLQVLQDGEFSRLGGDGNIVVNTRVLTTTKDHLERSMLEGRFREDLFYRINVISITVPPLRDRREQILPFSQYYFDHYRTKYGRTVSPLSLKTLNTFRDYHWPGNIRELENAIKRIVLFGQEEAVVQDLIRNKPGKNTNDESPREVLPGNGEALETFDLRKIGKTAAQTAERKVIQDTLTETHWNRRNAAKLLRVSYKALLNKIQKYGLNELEIPHQNEGAKDGQLRG